MDRVAFEKEGRGAGESGKDKNCTHTNEEKDWS